ncbi:hypothetical protein ACWXWU_03480 [Shewanella sp. A14]
MTLIDSNGDTFLDIMCLSQLAHGDQFKNYKMQGNHTVSDVSSMISEVKDGMGYTMIDLFFLEKPISELSALLTDH